MKIKHYSFFRKPYEALDSSSVWADLRNDDQEPGYFIPDSFEDYENNCPAAKLSALSELIVSEANARNIDTVFSVGCGKGYLEYQVKKTSGLKVIVTDYSESVLKLKSFNFFDSACQLNILTGEIAMAKDAMILFQRIDTEFTDEQWSYIFEKCFKAAIGHIIFVPAPTLSIKSMLVELKIALKHILARRRKTFCGYLRTEPHLKKLFSPYYHSKILAAGKEKVFKLTHKHIIDV